MRELSDDARVARTGRGRPVEIAPRSDACGRRVAQSATELPSLIWGSVRCMPTYATTEAATTPRHLGDCPPQTTRLGRARSLVAHPLHLGHRLTQPAEPVVGVLADQADAPRERLST